MRRSEREITDRAAVDAILEQGTVLYLGLQDDDGPYVVPMHYGFDGQALYLHSALEGRKITLLRAHPQVSFAVSIDHVVVPGNTCRCSARYRSVLGTGQARFLDDDAMRRAALDSIMGKYADGPFTYADDVLARTAVIQLDITRMTGKQAGY